MGFQFEAPLQLAHLRSKNLVIRSATHSFLSDKDGYMTGAEFQMYEALAAHDVGMIITGHCCVDPLGRANPEQVNIYADAYKAQFHRAAELCHAHGALFVPQISHAGPRAVDNDDLADVTARELKKGHHARALTVAEIQHIEQQFIAAAVRLKDAGVDGVQLHAAHSYLLSRFIDPYFNTRTDAYGGGIAQRFRMTEEIIAGIKAACGAAFPVLVKINSDTKAEDQAAYQQDMLWVLRRCHALGVELVELSGADFINMPKDRTLYYLDIAQKYKQAVPEQPMSLVGGVRSAADMEQVLASGLDAVSLSRALIAEPAFVSQQLAGGDKSICVSCCRCFALPHMHAGVRCVWEWKALRAKQRAAKAAQ